MRLALLAVLLVTSLSVLGQSRPEQKAPTQKENNETKNRQLPAAVNSQPSPQQQQQQTNKNPCNWPPFTDPFWSNWALVLVTVGGIWIALGTLRDLKKQTQLAEDAAQAANKSADAALKSAQVLIESERAWVMVDVFPSSYGVQKSTTPSNQYTLLSAVVVCINRGETIAWVTEKGYIFKSVKSLPQEPDFSNIYIFHQEPEPLAQEADSKFRLEAMCEGWYGEGNIVAFYGRVFYRDIFGVTRETRFGYGINLDGKIERLTGYPEYNKNL